MENEKMRPIKRSKVRLFLGKKYYIGVRYLNWILSSNQWAVKIKHEPFNNIIFEHKSLLRRNFKNVDAFIDDNKIVNISIALKRLDGIIINPGETFSYWKIIGKPTKSKGYLEGIVLDHGKYKLGIGGGLCQLSNLIYWMTLHTPLEIIERHRHSYDVFPDSKRTQPFGSGATCVYNYRDLQILNPTQEAYQIKVWMDDKYLHGRIFSTSEKYINYKVYEAYHHISHEFWGGYLRHNVIKRKVYDLNNIEIDDQFLCENHAIMMYSPFLNPPTDFNKTQI